MQVAEVIETKKAFKSNQKDEFGNPLHDGSILVRLGGAASTLNETSNVWAAPLHHMRRMPFIGENVLIYSGPGVETHSTGVKAQTFYYAEIVNVVNDVTIGQFPKNFIRSNTVANKSGLSTPPDILADKKEIAYTVEKKPKSSKFLQPFEGDDLWQGRFGQSIRFTRGFKETNSPGMGIYEKTPDSYWKGGTGDPLMVLRVKKPESGKGYDIEDVTKDSASIYLTTSQKLLKLKAGFSKNKDAAKIGNWASGGQVILDADRIVLNAKKDKLILISKKESILTGEKVLFQSKKYKVYLDDLMDWLHAAYGECFKLATAQAMYLSAMGPTGPATNVSQITKLQQVDWRKLFLTP